MFWKRKEKPLPDFSVADFNALEEKLDHMILSWLKVELVKGLSNNSKLRELAIFNFKIFYCDTTDSSAMRNFITSKVNVEEESEDYTYSRIQDLYVNLSISLPNYFIQHIRLRYLNVLKSIGFDLDEDLVTRYEFGWLLFKIQQMIRYDESLVNIRMMDNK
jgi:hypothetical protein